MCMGELAIKVLMYFLDLSFLIIAFLLSYDKSLAESSAPDSAYPDGCLCPACGECFHNNHAQMQHLLKVHSKSTGEQCVYCK